MVHNNKTDSAIADTITAQLVQQHDVISAEHLPRAPRTILVCGMGGSGIVGNLLPFHTTVPVMKHTSYGLPKTIQERTLVLVVSYSGATEETLSALGEAQARKLPVAVVTGGGPLRTRAQESSIPHVVIPWNTTVPTRYALGHLTSAACAILAACSTPCQMPGAVTDEKKAAGEARTIAERIHRKHPVVYAPHTLRGAEYVWKIFCNETAKVPLLTGVIPEVAHNEVEAIATLPNPSLVLLEDPHARAEIRKHTNAVRSLARSKKWQITDVLIAGDDPVAQIWYATTLAQHTADTLAALRNVDPYATPHITSLKGSL